VLHRQVLRCWVVAVPVQPRLRRKIFT